MTKTRVFLRGGLGNQLFGWAAGYALSRRRSSKLELVGTSIDALSRGRNVSPRNFELGAFGLSASGCPMRSATKPKSRKAKTYRIFSTLQKRHIYIEDSVDYDSGFQLLGGNTDLHGYFQSWHYFQEFVPEIREFLQSNFRPSQGFQELARELSAKPWVGVHIRLTDFLTAENVAITGKKYFEAALEEAKRLTNISRVVVFSDDSILARRYIRDADLYLGSEQLARPADSLVLMGQSAYGIYSNSTFSWWSAFLHQSPSVKKVFPSTWAPNRLSTSPGLLLPDWLVFDGA